MKTDPSPDTSRDPGWFAKLWAVESAKLREAFARSGVPVVPIPMNDRAATPGETRLTFVPARPAAASPQAQAGRRRRTQRD